MSDRFQDFTSERRVWWLHATLVVGIIAHLLLSPTLWSGERLFPRIHPFGWEFDLATCCGVALYLLTMVFLGVSLVMHSRLWLFGAGAALAIFALGDEMRWQAPLYFYALLLVATLSTPSRVQNPASQGALLDIARFLVIALYLWSGIHKLNANFIVRIFPWMVGGFLPIELSPPLTLIGGTAAALLEAGIGLSLLSPKLRSRGLMLALAMHVFILLCIGPLGHNWNPVVWPWNIIMMLLVVILFIRDEETTARAIVSPGGSRMKLSLLVLAGVMPAFNFVGLWDAYPSFSLYSGKVAEARIVLNEVAKARFPACLQGIMREMNQEAFALDVTEWSMRELGVPPYPEERVYVEMFRSLCRSYGGGIELEIYKPRSLLTLPELMRTLRCSAALLHPSAEILPGERHG